MVLLSGKRGISIHAPRVGSDLLYLTIPLFLMIFQSTLPVWGATALPPSLIALSAISIHAPRVGSDVQEWISVKERLPISIHAPRVGSDLCKMFIQHHSDISIHAPRVGSDAIRTCRAFR